MFFRRERPRPLTFDQRIENARQMGFSASPGPGGSTRVARDGYAIDLRNEAEAGQTTERAGVLMGGEIGALVDGGYQKFFRTATGKKRPALASDLKALHDFEEDLKEALGQKSLYNESLGTVSTLYLYDRVKDRDRGVPKRVWE